FGRCRWEAKLTRRSVGSRSPSQNPRDHAGSPALGEREKKDVLPPALPPADLTDLEPPPRNQILASASTVVSHPALPMTLGPNHPAPLAISRVLAEAKAKEEPAREQGRPTAAKTGKAIRARDVKPAVKPSAKFPLLTFASSRLTKADHRSLQQAGIRSGPRA